jgi:hypothetical protein
VHLVGYFHSCFTMHGFMNIKFVVLVVFVVVIVVVVVVDVVVVVVHDITSDLHCVLRNVLIAVLQYTCMSTYTFT